jgi:hypothetical protein
VASSGETGRRRLEAQGFDSIAPDQGLRALADALRGPRSHVAVLPVRWHRFREQLADGSQSLVRGLTGAAGNGGHEAGGDSIHQRLEAATTAAQRK